MIKQSEAAKRRIAATVAGCAGLLTANVYEYTFTTDYTAASDIIEMGMYPALNKLHSAHIIGENTGAVNADVGLVTGVLGDLQDGTRAVGTEILDAVAINNQTQNAALADCLAIPRQSQNVGVGVKLSADVAAGATKKITLVLVFYA